MSGGALRTRLAPSLRQLVEVAPPTTEAAAFVARLLDVPVAEAGESVGEFGAVAAALSARYDECRLVFPETWAVGDRSAEALYATVRLLRPDVVVETGVANGHSTYVVLSALRANGHGRLVSYDVADGAGVLVPESLRDLWDLTVLDRADPIADAARRLDALGAVDLFFHDADHSYVGQVAEYGAAVRALARGRGGVLLSDDVDESFAFVELVLARKPHAVLLVDARKVLGGCRFRP
jgi:predicted O-methyltransferase YrrM